MNSPAGRVQGCIQGQCSVTVVFESMPLGTSGGKGQHWVKPIQSLNGGLFSHAEHGRMAGWIQIQPDDIGGFGFKVRIVACHIRSSRCGFSPASSKPDALCLC